MVDLDKNQKQIIANNKKAYHDYFVLETYEAGIEPVSYTHLCF